MTDFTLAEVTRGQLVESRHQGVVVVVSEDGQTVARAGNPELVTYIRSAAKPLQAVPVITSGAADYYKLTTEELTVITASHSGEAVHIRQVAGILEKLGLSAGELQCGTHLPLHKGSSQDLLVKGLSPNVFHCTCSGKHAGMLALACYRGWDRKGYFLEEHPVQQAMLAEIAAFSGLSPQEIILGIDGCGVPVFALSMERMAYCYARLAKPDSLTKERQEACRILAKAMTGNPVIVAGTGRPATQLMNACGDRFIAKDGAEGVFCIAIPEKGWGVAVKIMDGSTRALGPVVVSALDQLGLLDDQEKAQLDKLARPQIKNYRGEVIGEIRPAFILE